MQRAKWLLISLVTLALILSSSLAFAGGQGQAKGNNSAHQTALSQQSGQGQWSHGQASGQSGRGYHKGWQKQGSARPSGLKRNSNPKGNCPQGLPKQR
jgi:hypothetical protein